MDYLTTINSLVTLAVQSINAARAVRDASRNANPTVAESEFPSDFDLIKKFLTEAQLLDKESSELREWLKTLQET